MVSSRKQLAPCPVCKRSDQVKKMQAAHAAGEHQFAQPPMPESQAHMMKYICAGMILVGLGAFFTLVLLSTNGFEFLPSNLAPIVSWLQAIVTIIFIVVALVLSFLAIRAIGQSDEKARQRYPLWDQAMANWNRLEYCARDKVVFDPQSGKALSKAAVKTLLDMDELSAQHLQSRAIVAH